MAGTIYHTALDVRRAIQWPKSKLRGMLRDEKGRLMTADEVRDALMDQLSLGREVIPVGACEDFDFLTGCRGHEVPTASTGGRDNG